MYDYKTLKPYLFTDDGQRLLLKIRDFIKPTLLAAGAIRMQEILNMAGSCDPWKTLACVDWLVELGELLEITGPDVPGQCRIFVRAYLTD